MNILLIITTAIITLFLYIIIIKPIYMWTEIRRVEKDIKGRIKMADELGKKFHNKVINIYNLYKEVRFTKNERALQLRIAKILYNYFIQNRHSKRDTQTEDLINGGIMDDDRVSDYYSRKAIAGKNSNQLEILLKNLLSSIKRLK